MQVNVNDIVAMINGKDEKNKAKSAITMQTIIMNVDGTTKETGNISCHKPEIAVSRRGKYIQIDLKFLSALDTDLKMMWGMLELHGENVSKLTNDSIEIPVLSLTMVPLEMNCKYYAVATNPIFWTLQPQKPGYEANTIRLLLESVNLAFYEAEGIDLEMIDRELEREEQR